jgi:ubiquinone/menaquinone biosynthesis C-methylase UbiE
MTNMYPTFKKGANLENNVFEQMASRYDTEDRMELAKVIAREVRQVLQNSTSKLLIDYGSGTGLVSLELSDLVDSILLVDSSKQMLDVAEAKIHRKGIKNARVLYSDFTQETPDLKADIVFMSLVLLHIPDTNKILQQLYTILNEAGKLIIVDFDKNDQINHPKVHNGFAHEELKNRLSEVGFRSIKIETFYHGERIFMNRDASMFVSSSIK